MKRFFKKCYLALILIFLYVPIVVLICQSFNAGKSRAKWEGFSFRWYEELFQNASIMNRFLKMLEAGTYREHREVSYYADCLCVSPKYLSEVSKKVSGYAANYWINRYTILDITRLLRDKSLTFVQISDMFGFSSPAYFSRYVQQNLGLNPTDYRK